MARFLACRDIRFHCLGQTLLGRLQAAGADERLTRTQFGFRRCRSTINPVHVARRVQDVYERAGTEARVVFLDWSKAFDRVRHDALWVSLARFRVDPVLQSLVKALHRRPAFMVTMHGFSSAARTQERGRLAWFRGYP